MSLQKEERKGKIYKDILLIFLPLFHPRSSPLNPLNYFFLIFHPRSSLAFILASELHVHLGIHFQERISMICIAAVVDVL